MHYPKPGSHNKDLQRTRNRNKKKRSKNSAHPGDDATSNAVTKPDAVLQGYRLQMKHWQTISKARGERRGEGRRLFRLGHMAPGTESAAPGQSPEESLCAMGTQQEEQDSCLLLQAQAQSPRNKETRVSRTHTDLGATAGKQPVFRQDRSKLVPSAYESK